jgi:hypothetical protein
MPRQNLISRRLSEGTYQGVARPRASHRAMFGQLGLSQAEERQDRENNDDQTDDVDDLVHDTKPPVALHQPLRSGSSSESVVASTYLDAS